MKNEVGLTLFHLMAAMYSTQCLITIIIHFTDGKMEAETNVLSEPSEVQMEPPCVS